MHGRSNRIGKTLTSLGSRCLAGGRQALTIPVHWSTRRGISGRRQAAACVTTPLADNRFGAAGEFAILRRASSGLEQTRPRLDQADIERLYDRHYGSNGVGDERLYRRLRKA